MAKPKNAIPTVDVHAYLPITVHQRLIAYLWSEAEGRVPHGAISKFFEERIKEFFDHGYLDPAAFTGAPPGTFRVRGDEASISHLKEHLK